MRTRFGYTLWNCPERRAPAVTALSTALCLTLAIGLAGCGNTPTVARGGYMPDVVPVDETGPWTNHPATQKEVLLAKSDFSVDIVRFVDGRRPRSMEVESEDQLLAHYDPDTLLQGVTVQVPALFNKYLAYRPHMPKHYKVEATLRALQTEIKTGTFWSGSWGRYDVTLEMDVLARRLDSKPVLVKTYRMHLDQPRQSHNGYGPSKERDRARLYDLTENAVRTMAQDIGWDIRQLDARVWMVEKDIQAAEAQAARREKDAQELPPVAPAAEANATVMNVPAPVDGSVDVPDVPADPSNTWPDWLKNAGIQAF